LDLEIEWYKPNFNEEEEIEELYPRKTRKIYAVYDDDDEFWEENTPYFLPGINYIVIRLD
jgi:hypothetical protein